MEKMTEDDISLWTRLAESKNPIAIYGMGDGAAKIISALNARGIRPQAVFASDDFVRNQSFMEYKVERLSEVEDRLGEFTVLLGFATHLDEIMERIDNIAREHELYIPDVNVAGDYQEVFDECYLESHKSELSEALGLFADEASRQFFITLCNYKFSGKMSYLKRLDELSSKEKSEREIISYCDLGAYCGDTLRLALERYPKLRQVIAFEPDPRSYRKLSALTEECLSAGRLEKALALNACAFSKNTLLQLGEGEGKASSLADSVPISGLARKKMREVEALTLDSITEASKISPDLIKLDVEGCEREALIGAKATLTSGEPDLIVSAYHRNEDLFVLPRLIKTLLPKKRLYLRRARKCLPAWEVEIIAK